MHGHDSIYTMARLVQDLEILTAVRPYVHVHYTCMYVYICMAEHVARAAAATVAPQDESPAYRLCYPFTCSSLVTTCHCQLIHVHDQILYMYMQRKARQGKA